MIKLLFRCALFLLIAGAVSRADNTSAGKAAASPLAPLVFLTQHEWDAALPDAADGTKISIHARFTWAENHQAIRISNDFVVNGKRSPYLDGLYAWNPAKHAIVFSYTDAEGSFYEGTVKLEKTTRVHEFQLIHPDGTVDSFIARSTPEGEGAWTNEIVQHKGDTLTPVAKVRYVVSP